MELSEAQTNIMAAMVYGELWSSGDFRNMSGSDIQRTIREALTKSVEKIEEDEKPLYYFSFHRLLVPVGEGDDLADEDVKKAEKKKSYMKILAKDEAAALHEAGRISAASGSENMWLFQPESIIVAPIQNRDE